MAADTCHGLGNPSGFAVVDVGAGRGELLTGLADLVPDDWLLLGVDVVERPATLDPRVSWSTERPARVTGLVMAHELLDVVPCVVVQVDEDGNRRQVLVDASTGVESLGGPPDDDDLAWLDRWWPVTEPGERAEVGRTRDALWQDLVRGLAARRRAWPWTTPTTRTTAGRAAGLEAPSWGTVAAASCRPSRTPAATSRRTWRWMPARQRRRTTSTRRS